MKKFLVISMTDWVAEDFSVGLGDGHSYRVGSESQSLELKRDFGFDPPSIPPQEIAGFWMPAAHAARLMLANYHLGWTAPGGHWLDNVSQRLTQRRILTSLKSEASFAEGVWKIAEAKLPSFESKWRTKEEVEQDAEHLPDKTLLQYSPDFLDIAREERFFVYYDSSSDQWKMFGTVYKERDWIYYSDLVEREVSQDSYEFLRDHLPSFAAFSPSAYVVDIATLADSSKAVLEANPAWCSAVYSANIKGAIQTIVHSSNSLASAPGKWVPDEALRVDAYRRNASNPRAWSPVSNSYSQ